MTKDKGWEEAELDLMLSQILEMRFGDGTGQDLQVRLALKEIKQLIHNLKHKWQAEAVDVVYDDLVLGGERSFIENEFGKVIIINKAKLEKYLREKVEKLEEKNEQK